MEVDQEMEVILNLVGKVFMNKKGFTLIDIIVSIAIISLVMIMFMSIIITSTSVTSKSVEINRESLISSGLVESAEDITTERKTFQITIGGQTFNTNIDISTSKGEVPFAIFEYGD